MIFGKTPNSFTKKETSKIALIPVNNQINNLLVASQDIDLYDVETDQEIYKQGIYTSDYVSEVSDTPQSLVDKVYDTAKSLIKTNKFIVTIAKEHFSTIGSIKAFGEQYENLTVLHIDSHARLRKEFNGNVLNDECAMYHTSQNTNLVQVGIRSISKLEKTVLDTEKTFFANDLVNDEYWIENVLNLLEGNIVLSFGFNGLDNSIMPIVEKPLPGGLLWFETLDFLKVLFQEKKVIGVNFTGITNENNHAANTTAANLIYKVLNYKSLYSAN